MSEFVAVRETNLDQDKFHWLVGIRCPNTLHGFLFFNPSPDSDDEWDSEKINASCEHSRRRTISRGRPPGANRVQDAVRR